MIHRAINQVSLVGHDSNADSPPPATGPAATIGAHATREDLVAALEREIALGLEAGDLVIPESRRRDHAWLKRNVRIDNRNARGQALFTLSQELFKMDMRAAMKRGG